MKKILLLVLLGCCFSGSASAVDSYWMCYRIGAVKLNPGSGYSPNVTLQNRKLAGGHGADAIADVTVGNDGKVSDVKLKTGGHDYVIGDVLTANLGSGTGFSLEVTSILSRYYNADGTLKYDVNVKKFPNPCLYSLPPLVNPLDKGP